MSNILSDFYQVLLRSSDLTEEIVGKIATYTIANGDRQLLSIFLERDTLPRAIQGTFQKDQSLLRMWLNSKHATAEAADQMLLSTNQVGVAHKLLESRFVFSSEALSSIIRFNNVDLTFKALKTSTDLEFQRTAVQFLNLIGEPDGDIIKYSYKLMRVETLHTEVLKEIFENKTDIRFFIPLIKSNRKEIRTLAFERAYKPIFVDCNVDSKYTRPALEALNTLKLTLTEEERVTLVDMLSNVNQTRASETLQLLQKRLNELLALKAVPEDFSGHMLTLEQANQLYKKFDSDYLHQNDHNAILLLRSGHITDKEQATKLAYALESKSYLGLLTSNLPINTWAIIFASAFDNDVIMSKEFSILFDSLKTSSDYRQKVTLLLDALTNIHIGYMTYHKEFEEILLENKDLVKGLSLETLIALLRANYTKIAPVALESFESELSDNAWVVFEEQVLKSNGSLGLQELINLANVVTD